jgi:hypothetical protein
MDIREELSFGYEQCQGSWSDEGKWCSLKMRQVTRNDTEVHSITSWFRNSPK